MNCMSEECQDKFQYILQLKDIFNTREILPQKVKRQKLFDINFQLKQIRHQQLKRLDQIINISIKNQPTQEQQGTEREISKQYNSLFVAHQQNICLSCDKYIFEKKVILYCYDKFEHNYHSNCLAKMMKQQLQYKCIKFQCLCKSQIKNGQIMKQRAFDLEVYINKLMENQLHQMKNHLSNIKICANKLCNFFWLINDTEKRRSSQFQSYNPYCRITYLNYCPHCRFS